MKTRMGIWQGATIVLATLSAVLLFVLFKGAPDSTPVSSERSRTDSSSPQSKRNRAAPLTLIENNDPVLGDKNADISVIEFSDFQCSYCARFFSTTQAEFRESDYMADGRVNWVYKHFPLNRIHPRAQKAAEAAECANRQGKFWDYHDMLFSNRDALDVPSLKTYASRVGLQMDEFNRCLEEEEARPEVSKELSLARAAGARGTPYFIIVNNTNGKGRSISGTVPYDRLVTAINSLF